MSGLIGAAQPNILHGSQDLRLNRQDWRRESLHDAAADAAAAAPAIFRSPWWPRSGFLGALGADIGLLGAVQWGPYDVAAGAASRFGFVGVSRDQYGSILGSCDMKLFRSSDTQLIDSTTSDPNSGAFLLNTPYYPDAHWIYQHKTGSPDLDGVSVNTLIGT